MANIKMNPQELIDLAGKLEQNASDCIMLAKTIKTNFDNGTANFEGATKNRAVTAFDNLLPAFQKQMPELLTVFASELRKTAENWMTLDG